MAKDRIGDWLWEEWDGEGYESVNPDSLIYVTYDNVDINEDIVKRALASCMQRDGVADSLADAFSMIEKSVVSSGYIGFVEGEKLPFVTDDCGDTVNGESTDYVFKATWVDYSE